MQTDEKKHSSNEVVKVFDSVHHRGLLMGLECELSEHEVLVLGRRFSEHLQPEVDVGLMLAVAQDYLRKKPFDQFADMARAFAHLDRKK